MDKLQKCESALLHTQMALIVYIVGFFASQETETNRFLCERHKFFVFTPLIWLICLKTERTTGFWPIALNVGFGDWIHHHRFNASNNISKLKENGTSPFLYKAQNGSFLVSNDIQIIYVYWKITRFKGDF